jgi:hypothetical protein
VKTKWVCGVNSNRSEVIVEEKEIKNDKVLFYGGACWYRGVCRCPPN